MENPKKIFIGVIIGVISTGIVFYYFDYLKNDSYTIRNCSFQLSDVKEYKGNYGTGQSSYFVYEGLIKNTSNNTEELKAVIAKLYNDKNIYIGEGYTSIGDPVKPGVSIPFKVQIIVSTYHDTVLRKYFDESNSFRVDIYPWFTTCQ